MPVVPRPEDTAEDSLAMFEGPVVPLGALV